VRRDDHAVAGFFYGTKFRAFAFRQRGPGVFSCRNCRKPAAPFFAVLICRSAAGIGQQPAGENYTNLQGFIRR